MLAGRFRIVRFIARGGMGEVYEAGDAELSTRVALKTISGHIVDDSAAIALFKREVQLAREVTRADPGGRARARLRPVRIRRATRYR